MKYTLLIDGHNFLFRTLYVLPQKKNMLMLSDKETQDLFVSKLSQNMNCIIRDMQSLADRCVLTLDSKSWRNNIKSDVNYKGTRKQQEESIDWNGFDICIQRFTECLKDYNICVSRSKLAEADDLIFMWSTALNAKNIPTIIYTSDKDMLQLVSASASNTDILLWSDVTKKLYVPKNFDNICKNDNKSFLESFAKGNSIDIYDRFANLEHSIRKKKLEKIEVDNVRFIFNKVLIGDKSDNISSVWSYEKNGRTYNVSEAKAEKILDSFIAKTGMLNYEFLFNDETVSLLAQSCNEVITDSDVETIHGNIKRNIQYMVLSKQVIPEEVLNAMLSDIRELAKNMKRINFANIKTNDEPVIKQTEKVFKGIDGTDFSFIKKPDNALF